VQLEVDIARKAFTNAAGERLDVLADFSFRLGAGEVGVFVGPSGCGKSTMLKIIAGLDHDYQGHVARPADARTGMDNEAHVAGGQLAQNKALQLPVHDANPLEIPGTDYQVVIADGLEKARQIERIMRKIGIHLENVFVVLLEDLGKSGHIRPSQAFFLLPMKDEKSFRVLSGQLIR
jgi:ABC-type dipeptide/oligopeptide/nickel transport system ATPase subunit